MSSDFSRFNFNVEDLSNSEPYNIIEVMALYRAKNIEKEVERRLLEWFHVPASIIKDIKDMKISIDSIEMVPNGKSIVICGIKYESPHSLLSPIGGVE